LLKKSSCWEEVGRIREHKKSSFAEREQGKGKGQRGKEERRSHVGKERKDGACGT
jgi:hypothetical protein